MRVFSLRLGRAIASVRFLRLGACDGTTAGGCSKVSTALSSCGRRRPSPMKIACCCGSRDGFQEEHDPQTENSRGHDRAVISSASRILELLAVSGFSFGASVVRAVPKNAIYVNVGQVGLAIPRIVSWLRHRPDVKSVFMLHDVIPLERPELVSSKDQRRHRRIVDRTARHASGLIASTEAAREAVLNALSFARSVHNPGRSCAAPGCPGIS